MLLYTIQAVDGQYQIVDFHLDFPASNSYEAIYHDTSQAAAMDMKEAINQKDYVRYVSLFQGSAYPPNNLDQFYSGTFSDCSVIEVEEGEGHALALLTMKQILDDGRTILIHAYLQLRYVENKTDQGWVVEGLLFYKPQQDWWMQ